MPDCPQVHARIAMHAEERTQRLAEEAEKRKYNGGGGNGRQSRAHSVGGPFARGRLGSASLQQTNWVLSVSHSFPDPFVQTIHVPLSF